MRHPSALVSLLLSLVCSACDDGRATALTQLERSGFTDVTLIKKASGSFEFTAKKGDEACGGSVTVSNGTATLLADCSASKVVEQKPPCSAEHTEMCGIEAETLIRKGKGAEGVEKYRIGCEAGAAMLCLNLGAIYSAGDAGIDRDAAKRS